MNSSSTFSPNWYSTPGNSITDILEVKNISKADFSHKMKLSTSRLDDLLSGYMKIDHNIATKLSENIGGSTDFWMQREENYREDLNRIEKTSKEDLISNFDVGYVSKVVNDLKSYNEGKAFLDYFGVPDYPSWERKYENLFNTTFFKKSKSYQADKVALATWLRGGELCAKEFDVNDWNKDKLLGSLEDIKALTKEKNPSVFLPELKKIFADCGVKFIVLKTPSRCPINGAIRIIKGNQPLVILSFRYKTDDHFWFTIFHEIGHLLLHNIDGLYLEKSKFRKHIDKVEDEANNFAETILLSGLDKFELERIRKSHRNIVRKAVQLGISPGILVGQMQFNGVISYNNYNKLKRKYSWSKYSFIQ